MNYLAHLRLAGASDDARIGQFLGDFVKGSLSRYGDRYRPSILRGIQAHRAIDCFTDCHPLHRQSRLRLPPAYRRLSGIIIDIGYDHFLSQHWHRYSSEPLPVFIDRAYQTLLAHQSILPDRLQRALPLIIQQNWLSTNYTVAGLGVTFQRVARRLSHPLPLQTAHYALLQIYDALEQDFLQFFPTLLVYAAKWERSPPDSAIIEDQSCKEVCINPAFATGLNE
jgi:acyl carrier protein phosphodiesterase